MSGNFAQLPPTLAPQAVIKKKKLAAANRGHHTLLKFLILRVSEKTLSTEAVASYSVPA